MDFSKFTLRAQEAFQKAQEFAQENQHQVLESGHLMLGLLAVDKDLIPALLEKQGVDVARFRAAVNAAVNSFPKVQGGALHISNALNAVLTKGLGDLNSWGDSYLAVDALFYYLCQANDTLGAIVKDAGINSSTL